MLLNGVSTAPIEAGSREWFEKRFESLLLDLRVTVGKLGVAIYGTGTNFHTVGLAKLGLPDLVISTHDHSKCQWFLNVLFEYWRDNGIELGFIRDAIVDDQGVNIPVMIIPVSAKVSASNGFADVVHVAHAFYDRFPEIESFKCSFAQVLWPDPEGRFPQDEGYSKSYMYDQEIYDSAELLSIFAPRIKRLES